MIVRPDRSSARESPKPDRSLIKAIARAYAWRDEIESGDAGSLTEIAAREGVSQPYLIRILRLAYLAPDVIEASMVGNLRH